MVLITPFDNAGEITVIELEEEDGWELDLTKGKAAALHFDCNSAPSKVLSLIALRAKGKILQRNNLIVAATLSLLMHSSQGFKIETSN